MAVWLKENCKVTQSGLNLLAKLQDGKQLTITKAVCGSNRISASELEQQTDILDVKKTLEIRKVASVINNKAVLLCLMNSKGVTEKFILNQIGIYAQDPDDPNKEILYIILQAADESNEIPTEAEMPEYEEEYMINVLFQNETGFFIVENPTGYVSEAEFQQLKDDYTALYNLMLTMQVQIESASYIIDDDTGEKYRLGKDSGGLYVEKVEETTEMEEVTI